MIPPPLNILKPYYDQKFPGTSETFLQTLSELTDT